jgi:hypothetical protein
LFLSASLFARAKAEEPVTINTEYTLCITAFDVTNLPPSQQNIGSIFQNRIATRLSSIQTRKRTNFELDRYTEAAWIKARGEAAVKVASKREERDKLLYQGLPGWKYKKELKRVTEELAVLQTDYRTAEEQLPRVEPLPLFKLDASSFPPAPESGAEETFLETQKADSFLAAKFSSYYGRVLGEFRFYTKNGAGQYEDSVLFSPEDLSAAADEIIFRLEEALSGEGRSRLTVKALPENAAVLVGGKLAVKGEPSVVNPGETTLSVSAEGYRTERGNLTLAPGEEKELDIALEPLNMESLRLNVDEPSKVYIGSLYIGTASPGLDFDVAVPVGQYRYLNLETESGKTGQAIVMGEFAGDSRSLSLKTRVLPGKDETPVEKRRRQFYGAWGRLWVTLPLAFFLNGLAQTYADASNSYVMRNGVTNQKLYDNAMTSFYVARGALITAGVFGVESIIRLVVYIYTANREAVELQ